MKRYVLHHRGGEPAAADLRALTAIGDLRILDHELPHVVLVEASEEAIAAARRALVGWSIAEETTYPKPSDPERDPR